MNATKLGVLAVGLGWALNSTGAPLINFPFNEGTGGSVTDTASGLVGTLGTQQDPFADTVVLADTPPSSLAGDRCITTSGNGFLVADDSANKVLAITNGPITVEAWININGLFAKPNEGIVAYGGSYKMGMRGGWHVFTLYGLADITNSAAGIMPADVWTHLAAAWEPGVGVHFYVNGVSNFTAYTAMAARPPLHNYLSIASEGLGNNVVASIDRVRIHNALLTADELDSDPGNPKPATANTLVSYNFNEAALPSTNAVAPPLPTMLSSDFLPSVTSPVWTNDTPSGLTGDFALGFLTERPPVFESIAVPFGGTPINLGENNTNYTLQAWVKLPTSPFEERRVIYRADGPAPRVVLSINANRTMHSTILGTADWTTSVAIPNDNRWHHLAVVMQDFALLHFYLDGILRQTVNRTQAGVPSAGGTAGLTIGKESETRYFRGVLDRVLINNDALTVPTLDYPAIPGLATFDSLAAHPADLIVDEGSTAVFTAAPTSASTPTYQWYYRTNLADHVSVALPGETSTTLTLNNVTAANEGFYFLVVTNAVGASESYAARLTLTSSLAAGTIGFESPGYSSGPIEGQDYWTTDQNGNAVRVLTDAEITAALESSGRTAGQTVHGGTQALLVNGAGLATASVRSFTGLETANNVTLDVWARPLAAGTVGTSIGNVFLTMENATGTRAAAFRFGPSLSIDYGLVSGSWVATGLIADPNTWYHLTLRLDYGAQTYDFLVDGVQINTSPIPFYSTSSDSFRQIRVFRGANQAGMIVDDLTVQAAAPALRITDIAVTGSTVTISWEGGQSPYQLQRRNSVTGGDWEDVGLPTSSTQGTDTLGEGPMFYRVLSN